VEQRTQGTSVFFELIRAVDVQAHVVAVWFQRTAYGLKQP
jgi:hypothetical protein